MDWTPEDAEAYDKRLKEYFKEEGKRRDAWIIDRILNWDKYLLEESEED